MSPLLSLSAALPPLIWIAFSAILFTSGDIVFRFWYQSSSTLFFVVALTLVTIGMFFLAMSFPHQNIAVATVVAVLINITLYLVAAFLIFGDMPTIKEAIGLLLGFVAIYILEAL